jgi:hypothetical protein
MSRNNKNRYINLILMSFFSNNILSNSLYSYIGGYLSNNKNIIIMPIFSKYDLNKSIKL